MPPETARQSSRSRHGHVSGRSAASAPRSGSFAHTGSPPRGAPPSSSDEGTGDFVRLDSSSSGSDGRGHEGEAGAGAGGSPSQAESHDVMFSGITRRWPSRSRTPYNGGHPIYRQGTSRSRSRSRHRSLSRSRSRPRSRSRSRPLSQSHDAQQAATSRSSTLAVPATENEEVVIAKERQLDTLVKADEFGGPWGAFAIILVSHLFTYYLYVSLHKFGGGVPWPDDGESGYRFFLRMVQVVLQEAWPTWFSVRVYLSFVALQAVLAAYGPGIMVKGLPLPSEGGRQLLYRCNGIFCWYTTLVVYAVCHATGFLPLTVWVDNYGPLLTTAVVFGNLVSLAVYLGAHATGTAHRMSGNHVYDFFMGAPLNPRLLNGRLDIKFWAETRISWGLLFLLSASMCVKEYETRGAVSSTAAFMFVAHFLYANACMKGEECIPTTWDIFYEKFGFYLCWWNFAGVPFVYSCQTLYLYYHNKNHGAPLTHHPAYTAALFVVLCGAYYVWDTSNSQKNRFRMASRGTYVQRKAFPQFEWGTLTNPRVIKTKLGSPILVDGWWGYARKMNYTSDLVMALSWGLITGFTHFLPYVYFFFFFTFLMHRVKRDMERCAAKYGEDWERYCREVPYVFIPYVF